MMQKKISPLRQQRLCRAAQRRGLIILSIALSLLPFVVLVCDKQCLTAYLYLFPFTFLYTYPILPGGKRFKDLVYYQKFLLSFYHMDILNLLDVEILWWNENDIC
jgi:hypothetical protein